MENIVNILPWLAGGLILVIAVALLHRPIEGLMRLLARTGVGLAVLFAVNQVGAIIGITLGVNLTNALVLGVLGAPGLGLLLLVHWTLL